MTYKVLIKKKVLKSVTTMPAATQQRLKILVDDLRDMGPARAEWPNYSKLSKNEYHCHLGYKWVACWRMEKKSIEIEVYYAGSRENAPY